MYIIELIGLPGSGKTYFYDKLKKKLEEKKFEIVQPKNFFIKKVLLEERNFLRKIVNVLYYMYIKKISLESKKIFKNQYKYLIDKINKRKKILSSSDIKIIKIYNYYLSKTKYSESRKKRSMLNFLIEIIARKEVKKNKIFFKNKIILIDEGFYQKIYLNFKELNYYKFLPFLKRYLNLIPEIDLLIHKDKDIKKNMKIVKKRDNSFKYIDENNLKVLGKPLTFFKDLKNNIKKRKTKIYVYKKNKNIFFNLQKIIKEINP